LSACEDGSGAEIELAAVSDTIAVGADVVDGEGVGVGVGAGVAVGVAVAAGAGGFPEIT
jgi:hypothetical protein